MQMATTKESKNSELPRRGAHMEQHFTVGELALHWRMSPRTVKDWFADEPGVIRFGSEKLQKGKQLEPISVCAFPNPSAVRVYHRITGQHIQPTPRS